MEDCSRMLGPEQDHQFALACVYFINILMLQGDAWPLAGDRTRD